MRAITVAALAALALPPLVERVAAQTLAQVFDHSLTIGAVATQLIGPAGNLPRSLLRWQNVTAGASVLWCNLSGGVPGVNTLGSVPYPPMGGEAFDTSGLVPQGAISCISDSASIPVTVLTAPQ